MMSNDEKRKALMDSEIDGFVIQYGLLSNDEKRKALIDSEIDGLCIRYSLSDAARRAIKKICEFDKLNSTTCEIGQRKAVVRFTRHITMERSEESAYTTSTCSAYAEPI